MLELISLVVSLVAVAVAGVSYYYAGKAFKAAQEAEKNYYNG